MTKSTKEKMIEEFREKFLKQKICKACLREACDYSTTGCPWYQVTLTLNKDTEDWEDTGEQMLAFLSTSIAQALAEERERVVGEIEKPLKIKKQIWKLQMCIANNV